jgi:hypothetical protein
MTADRSIIAGASPGPVEFGDRRIPHIAWDRLGEVDGCWLWHGATDQSGYGRVRFQGKHHGVHRLVLFCLGVAVDEWQVMHSCNNPPCCNPAHLSTGTNSDNQLDSVRKKRHAAARKTKCPAGHSYAEFGVVRNGKRCCRRCQVAASLRWQAKQRSRKANL